MASLYQIQEDILRIFDTVESCEGEITDEQYDALCIKQEELNTKLDAYVKAIKSWEVDEKALKEEKQKLNNRQNVYKNRVQRLKQAALQAVLNFGEHGKSNMFIELQSCRLFTRNSESVVMNEDRARLLQDLVTNFVYEIESNGIACYGRDVDLEGILASINANGKAEMGDDFIPFTIADLNQLKFTVSQTASIVDLFKRGDALHMIGNEFNYTNIERSIDSNEAKTYIKASKEHEELPKVTIADVVINQSLQIK